jgi:hypothetical protein
VGMPGSFFHVPPHVLHPPSGVKTALPKVPKM